MLSPSEYLLRQLHQQTLPSQTLPSQTLSSQTLPPQALRRQHQDLAEINVCCYNNNFEDQITI